MVHDESGEGETARKCIINCSDIAMDNNSRIMKELKELQEAANNVSAAILDLL